MTNLIEGLLNSMTIAIAEPEMLSLILTTKQCQTSKPE